MVLMLVPGAGGLQVCASRDSMTAPGTFLALTDWGVDVEQQSRQPHRD
jgi:hypothetical protein